MTPVPSSEIPELPDYLHIPRTIQVYDMLLGEVNIVARMSRMLDSLSYLYEPYAKDWPRALSNREVLTAKPITNTPGCKFPANDHPIGYLAYRATKKKEVNVISIGVEPDFRRQGVCRKLIEGICFMHPKKIIYIPVPERAFEICPTLLSMGFTQDYVDTVSLLNGKVDRFIYFSYLR